ncbi:MAG: hypothetical protein LLF95_11385 [Bacteroidales bacterium]|nr:hypothetical protein [Bacteroidales bacterium]
MEENIISVNKTTIQGLNESEIEFIQSKINDKSESTEDKKWWRQDLKDLKTNPSKYWNAFITEIKSEENNLRVRQIKAIQEYYSMPEQLGINFK